MRTLFEVPLFSHVRMVDFFALARLACLTFYEIFITRRRVPARGCFIAARRKLTRVQPRTHKDASSQFFEQENRTHFQTREHLRKKPVIVNGTTKSSVRSQRDKTAFPTNNPAILAELKVYRERKEHQQSSGRTGKENLFFFSVVALKYVGVGVVKFS